jgi:AraC family transcriptional regulator
MAVKVVNVKSQLVLGIRELGSYNKIGEIITKLAQYAASRGIEITGDPIFISHETAEVPGGQGNEDLEIAVPVGEKTGSDEESMETGIICYTIPGGTFAKILHKGPYEKSEESYKELFSWIKEKGYRIIGPIREVYLKDPKEFGPPELETEIYAPVQKGREDKKLEKEDPESRSKDYKKSFHSRK